MKRAVKGIAMVKGVYVHIPFCVSKCNYCDFVSGAYSAEIQRRYVNMLVKEIGEYCYETLETLYIGGGTPSCLFDGAIKEIADALAYPKLKEFTVEVNPDSLTEKKLNEYKNAGVTRISVGVQSMDRKVLKAAGRRHDGEQARQVLKLIKSYGFDLSADVLLGLEFTNIDNITETIEQIVCCGVEHMSVYMLEGRASGLSLPDDDLLVDMYEAAYLKLKENGFERYEISNFAKNGKISLHNYAYWTGVEYLGLGVAAHSFYSGCRYENTSDIEKYLKYGASATVQTLEAAELLYERIILGLRTTAGLGIDMFSGRYKSILEQNPEFFLIESGRVRIRDEYFLIMNSILAKF